MKEILMVSGDIGGAKAMIPVLKSLLKKNFKVTLIKHGWLEKNFEILDEKRTNIKVLPSDLNILIDYIKKRTVDLLFFTPSKKDIFPITLAREAKKNNIAVFYLLDSALRIKERLNHDKKELFLPTIYGLQDQDAYDLAVSEGIPKKILKVTGQPALEDLKTEFSNWSNKNKEKFFLKNKIDKNKKLIIFVSENVKKDHGLKRGYHQDIVIPMLCKNLEKFSENIHLLILPHPAEDSEKLIKTFKKNCIRLSFSKISKDFSSRQAVMASDGVSGMASILLYEGWLIGKNVISLQPGVIGPNYTYLKKKEKLKFVSKKSEFNNALKTWLEGILSKNDDNKGIITKNMQDLVRHSKASNYITELIERILKK